MASATFCPLREWSGAPVRGSSGELMTTSTSTVRAVSTCHGPTASVPSVPVLLQLRDAGEDPVPRLDRLGDLVLGGGPAALLPLQRRRGLRRLPLGSSQLVGEL